MICIGDDVIYNNKKYHVQDRDNLNSMIYIGEIDNNNLCLNCIWVNISEVEKLS